MGVHSSFMLILTGTFLEATSLPENARTLSINIARSYLLSDHMTGPRNHPSRVAMAREAAQQAAMQGPEYRRMVFSTFRGTMLWRMHLRGFAERAFETSLARAKRFPASRRNIEQILKAIKRGESHREYVRRHR
jgi:hypothetical protein